MTDKKPYSSTRKFDSAALKSKMLEAASGKKSYKDDRFWKLTRDNADNGYAVIRFLPGLDGVPFVKTMSHFFQGPGGTFAEACPRTIGLPCPVCEANYKLDWDNPQEQEIIKDRKAAVQFISNILVVSDPAQPSNEGKVFLFKYGPKIFGMLNEVANNPSPGEPEIIPFDPGSAGANFKLKIKKQGEYLTYDSSTFSSQSAISADPDEIEELLGKQISLAEFTDPANFTSYEKLEEKLDRVLNGGKTGKKSAEQAVDDQVRSTAASPEQKSLKEKLQSASIDDDVPFDGSKKVSAPAAAPEEDEEIKKLKALIGE